MVRTELVENEDPLHEVHNWITVFLVIFNTYNEPRPDSEVTPEEVEKLAGCLTALTRGPTAFGLFFNLITTKRRTDTANHTKS